ncbi:MAG: hypothetical protein AAGA90_16395 [Actinomycetota bacterium]
MDIAGAKQGDISAALRRAAIVDAGRPPTFSAAHVLQFVGTLALGVALLLGHLIASIAVGLAGAAAIAVALRRNPGVPEPEVDDHFDERTGLPLASALPIVVRDDQAMASLTGRVGVLVLDVHGAAARLRRGDERTAAALMSMIIHRLEGHAWSYPLGGSFSPLFFLEAPSTIVIVRRDLLGDQSNQWLTERLLDEVSTPMPWEGGVVRPEISIGGATGPVADGPALVTLAALARRDARAGGAGTVTIRSLERDRRAPKHPIEVVAADHSTPLGVLFESSDPGSRVGIFEHLASLRTTFNRAVLALADNGARPLIGASVTALSHPAAATDMIQRASAAGVAGRVGLVLPPDFPTTPDHRAVDNVEKLHQAGFLVIADRREAIDHLKTLPFAPIDVVMVGPDFNDLGTGSQAERALLNAAHERHAGLAHARIPVQAEAVELPSSLLEGAKRLNQGGRPDHLAKAGVTGGR